MTAVALRSLAGHKFRAALTALAIVLGVAMISGTYTLTDSIGKAFDTIFQRSFASSDAVVSGKQAFSSETALPPSFPEGLLGRVRALPGVEAAAGSIADSAQIVGKDGKTVGGGGPPTLAFGVDPTQTRFSPLTIVRGAWPRGPGEVVVDEGTAKDEGLRVGDRIGIVAKGPARRFRISGIARFGGVASLGGATITVFDLQTAQRLFAKEGRLDSIAVAAAKGVGPQELVAQVRSVLPAGTQVRTGSQEAEKQSSDVNGGISILQDALLAFGGIALFVGAFIIFNSLSITVAQRAREFALLRTIGASRRQVLASVVLEAFVLGVVASVAGLFLGLALGKGLSSFFTSVGIDLPQAGLVFATRTIVVSLVVGTAITVLASLVPAVRATRVPPIAVLREGSTVPRTRFSRFVPALALLVAALGVALLALGLFSRGIAVTPRLVYLGGGCLLLFVGVALLSPKLVRPLASAIGWVPSRVDRATGPLARENAMRNPGRTAATAAALMIGVTLVTFVAVFAQGLKHSFSQAINDQLRADYVVTARDGFTPFDPSSTAALRRVPGVVVSGVRGERGKAFGSQTSVTGLAPTIARSFHFDWVDGSDALLPRLGAHGAVLARSYAEDHRLRVGSTFRVQSPSGSTLDVVVRGIFEPPAFANMLAPINVSAAAFDSNWLAGRNLYTFVETPAGPSPQLQQRLAGALRGFPDQQVRTQPALVDKWTGQIDMVLNILYVLLALSVIVSLFGIVNTLVLSVFERTRELGMLRAIGTTRWQVGRMIGHESIITALIGAVLGIGVGVGLGALVTLSLASEGLVFSVPWASLVGFAFVAAVAGVLAAILPAWRGARLDVLRALQYE